MPVISAIQKHNRRIYTATLSLFLFALLFAVGGYLSDERGPFVGWALAFCILTTAGGLVTLIYLRRSLRYRLDQAATAESALQRLIAIDPLTGAMTRRHFLEALAAMMGTPMQPQPTILLLVDLDHFKQLNDTFGHTLGDEALARTVHGVKHLFPEAAIGRLGGDEFAIALPGTDIDDAGRRAAELIRALHNGILHEGNTIPLSASIGIAACPNDADELTELVGLADLALYESKDAGRGRVSLYREDFTSEMRQRRYMERELRAAIFMDELELHYQPVVNAQGEAYGSEALVRWRHPVRGMIPPCDFIPIAERSNLIDLVGAWVFRRACEDLPDLCGKYVGINVSGEQLKRDNLVHMLRRTLAETGRQASEFVIEITETVATAGTPDVLHRIETLREMGFRISLDDFGTGHCGFNYLKTLPIDSIKIDRSYIRSLAQDGIAQVFVSAMVEIAHMRGLTLVAEGVETEAELVLARAAGCSRFQGYYFGRPAPVSAYTRTTELPKDRAQFALSA